VSAVDDQIAETDEDLEEALCQLGDVRRKVCEALIAAEVREDVREARALIVRALDVIGFLEAKLIESRETLDLVDARLEEEREIQKPRKRGPLRAVELAPAAE